MPYLFIIFILNFFCLVLHHDALGNQEIMVLVEDKLASPLTDSIEQYKSDLEKEGYKVIVKKDISAVTSPSDIREILQEQYEKSKNLVGAVFVGKIPAPLYNEISRQGDPYFHDYLSDLYYMDLDGIWSDVDKKGVYHSHKNFQSVFLNRLVGKMNKLLHNYWEGRTTPEIWVSRLRSDTLSSLGDEVTLLKAYFAKNHSYRVGEMPLPPRRAFVVSPTIDEIKSDRLRVNQLYSDVTIVQCDKNSSVALRDFLNSKDGYEWGVISVFSGPRIHHFDYKEGVSFDPSWHKTREGKELIVKYSEEIHNPIDVSWLDVKAIQPRVLFYHLVNSEVGRHDYIDYLAGIYIFSGSGLVAIAGTQHGGANLTPVFYNGLASRKTIGEAWREALSWSILNPDTKLTVYWCDHVEIWTPAPTAYKAVLIGDGTLRLPE